MKDVNVPYLLMYLILKKVRKEKIVSKKVFFLYFIFDRLYVNQFCTWRSENLDACT